MGFNTILMLIFPTYQVALIITYFIVALFGVLQLTNMYLESKRIKTIKTKINELHFQKK